jgi:hypothetical protein
VYPFSGVDHKSHWVFLCQICCGCLVEYSLHTKVELLSRAQVRRVLGSSSHQTCRSSSSRQLPKHSARPRNERRRTKNLRAVQLLLGHTQLESTVPWDRGRRYARHGGTDGSLLSAGERPHGRLWPEEAARKRRGCTGMQGDPLRGIFSAYSYSHESQCQIEPQMPIPRTHCFCVISLIVRGSSNTNVRSKGLISVGMRCLKSKRCDALLGSEIISSQ